MLKFFGFLTILCISTLASSQDTMKTFIFGHSLIHYEFPIYETPSQETTVPHWLHFLTQEANTEIAVSGQYGFLPQHANLPPMSQWSYDFVTPLWESDYEPFSAADFDNILLTPGNFIQWQEPQVPYYGDTQSPLDYTRQIFDWTLLQEPGAEIFIYENWPDMGEYLANGFPPTPNEWVTYNNYLMGDFHDWFLAYHDSLQSYYPDRCINLIPVGPVISDVLSQPPYNSISIDVLYEDNAPHGRPTVYFMAAMVTYMAMYDQEPPASYVPPSIIDPVVAENYSDLSGLMWQSLSAFEAGELLCVDSSCPEDIDGNGIININDFLLFNSAFGTNCMSCAEDIDGSGTVNIDDFLLLNSAFGSTCL